MKAKLTPDEARAIMCDSRSATVIAEAYGVCRHTVFKIKDSTRYKRATRGLTRVWSERTRPGSKTDGPR